jgi:radical SAM superfamily enzyme YgiQ (UPF0313 family)
MRYDNFVDRYFMPFGLLNLAAVAENLGHSVVINQYGQGKEFDARLENGELLPVALAKLIAEKTFDIVGFTTKGDNLPLTIEVARQLRLISKKIRILIGGPGVSVVDIKIIETFPWINVVARGEGEETFAELLPALENHTDLSNIKGITFKKPSGQTIKTPDRPLTKNLDKFSDTPYHFVEHILSRPEIFWTDVLAGRGCPNGCSFCTTGDYWGRRIRMRPPRKVYSEMKLLHDKYGIHYFSLIHDNIFYNRRFMKEFCELLRKGLKDIHFALSACVNLSSSDMIRMVARSGCTSVFLGIETGSKNLARHIPRKYCSPEEVHNVIRLYRKHEISLSKSYVIGFPDETYDDINKTLMLALQEEAHVNIHTSERFRTHPPERTLMHPLTIYPCTKLYEEYGENLSYTGITGDWADHRILDIESCLNMCKKYPSIFTAYAACTKGINYSEIIELCNFYRFLIMTFPKSILVALRQLNLSPVDFLTHFRKHALARNINFKDFGDCINSHDPFARQLLRCFPEVVAKMYQDAVLPQHFLRFFLDYEQPRVSVFFKKFKYINIFSEEYLNNDSLSKHIPIIPRTTVFLPLSSNPDKLFSRFYLHGKTGPIAGQKMYMIYFLPRHKAKEEELLYAIQKMSKLQWKLTTSVVPFIDGKRTCSQIISEAVRNLRVLKKGPIIRNEVQENLRTLIKSGIMMLSEELSETPRPKAVTSCTTIENKL